MRLNEPELKIKVSKEMLKHLLEYCKHCIRGGFEWGNDFYRIDATREALLLYSLNSFIEKLMSTLYKQGHESDSKILTMRLNKAERIAMSVMFKRVELPMCLAEIEFKIINKLTLQK